MPRDCFTSCSALSLKQQLSLAVSAALTMGSAAAQSPGLPVAERHGISPFLPVQATDPAYADWFYSSPNYTYCDAKLLAHFWGVDAWTAKLEAGWKLANGAEGVVDDLLGQARGMTEAQQQQSPLGGFCGLEDADNPPYSWDDLGLLAQYWGMNNAEEAKLRVVDALFYGGNARVVEDLGAARGF